MKDIKVVVLHILIITFIFYKKKNPQLMFQYKTDTTSQF